MTIVGGVPPYVVELLDDSGNFIQQNTSGIFNGLCAGCYSINIYDFNWSSEAPDECMTTLDLCIGESNPLIEATIIPAGCGTVGNALFNFPGGVSPYNITLNLDGVLSSEELNYEFDNYVFENLPSGSYDFIFEDFIGCGDSFSFNIDNIVNDIEIVDFGILDPLCWNSNGSANIEFSASYIDLNFPLFGTSSIALDDNGDCILNSEEVIVAKFGC